MIGLAGYEPYLFLIFPSERCKGEMGVKSAIGFLKFQTKPLINLSFFSNNATS